MSAYGGPSWEWHTGQRQWVIWNPQRTSYITEAAYHRHHEQNRGAPQPTASGTRPHIGSTASQASIESGRAVPSGPPGRPHTLPDRTPSVRWATPRETLNSIQPQDGQPGSSRNPHVRNVRNVYPNSSEEAPSIIRGHDRRSGVRSVVQTGPANAITDPELFNVGIRAHGRLQGSEREAERLYPSFKKRQQPRSFFVLGRVFMVLWAEPAGEPSDRTLVTAGVRSIPGKHGERIFSKVRRFIVIRESEMYCSALPILSYGEQGVKKQGVIKFEHGVAYIGKQPPVADPEESPGPEELGMQPIPVRITPDERSEKLMDMSRINYGKLYTVEHNVKVRNVGTIHPGSKRAFISQFRQVWENTINAQVEERDQPRTYSKEELIQALVGRGYSREEATSILEQRGQPQQEEREEEDEEEDEEDPDEEYHAEEDRETQHEERAQVGRDRALRAQSQMGPTATYVIGTTASASLPRSNTYARMLETLELRGYSREQALEAIFSSRRRNSEAREAGASSSRSDTAVRRRAVSEDGAAEHDLQTGRAVLCHQSEEGIDSDEDGGDEDGDEEKYDDYESNDENDEEENDDDDDDNDEDEDDDADDHEDETEDEADD